MYRQSLIKVLPRPSIQSGWHRQCTIPLVQRRGYADAPPKQVKGAFLGKKNKDVIT